MSMSDGSGAVETTIMAGDRVGGVSYRVGEGVSYWVGGVSYRVGRVSYRVGGAAVGEGRVGPEPTQSIVCFTELQGRGDCMLHHIT